MKKILVFLILVVFLSFVGQLGLSLSMTHLPVEVLVYVGAYGQIAIGALLYLSVKYYGSFFSKRILMSFWIMLAGLFALLSIYLFDLDYLKNYLVAAGTFLFLLGGINLPFFQSKALRIFSLPGKYSYGNYLFHITILYLIHSYLWNLNIIVAFLTFVAATTILASFSFHFFETPANQSIRKLFGVKSSNL